MKVRIGLSTAIGVPPPEGLEGLAAALEVNGFDSLWLPEVLSVPSYDPLVALAWLAGRHPSLKIGTTMLLPGRNLVRLAKQVASLDVLSGGRFLVTVVPGLPRGAERDAVGVAPSARGEAIDEGLPVLRRLWAGEAVTHHGAGGSFTGVTLAPRPVQDPFEVWLGGSAPAALERCGRLGDGWLPSQCAPEDAAAGREVIERVATSCGRRISDEHFGVSLVYARQPLGEEVAAALAARLRLRGRPVAEVVPDTLDALRTLLERFVVVGFSKFVVRPLSAPVSGWDDELAALAGAVGDLQT